MEMERFGEGSTLDVIMATQFSTDRTKLKLETFLKLRKMIKSDFIYSFYFIISNFINKFILKI